MPPPSSPSSKPSGYGEFEFDLPEALLRGLRAKLDNLTAARLTEEAARDIPNEQGVYQLFLDGKLVYIGKTDGDAGLSQRLGRHAQKIKHRKSLDPARVSFKALRVFVFTAVDLESYLIKSYGGVSKVPWSGSGFGSNDPGRERDTTTIKDDHYDARYPIDIDRDTGLVIKAGMTAAEALTLLKATLPYTLRFATKGGKSRSPHPELSDCVIGSASTQSTARGLLSHIVRFLTPGWQATEFPGYLILYKERDRDYPHGRVLATSPG